MTTDSDRSAIAADGAETLEPDAAVMSLRHELLVSRDRAVGLEAELETCRARLAVMEATDLGRAFARVDELEDERQAMLHELRWTITSQRKVAEDYRMALEGVMRSVPFRLGNVLVSPARRVIRIVRR